MPHHKTKRAKEPKIYGPNTGTPTRKELHKMGPTKRKPLPPPAPHPNKRKPQPPAKRKNQTWVNPGWNPEGKTIPQGPVRTDKIEDRPGFFPSGMKMQMGSKQKNTPSNFSESAFKMIVGGDPGDDFFEFISDPKSSLGQNQMENMNEAFDEMKAGYQPRFELISKDNQGAPDAYASLGKGLRNLIKPKPGTEGYARQQERKANREVKRFERGKVNVSSGDPENPNAYDTALANQKTWKGKKGTQTKIGEKLRNIKKKIFK